MVSLIGGGIVRQVLMNFVASQFQNVQANLPQIKVTAKTRGGHKLRAFIVNASDKELVAGITARLVRRRLIPPLKLALPKRTGVLVASLYVKQNGTSVALWGVFYAPFVKAKNGQTIYRVIADVMERHRGAIGREVIQELVRRSQG